MKTIDLKTSEHSLSELLALAESEPVLIRSADGHDFVLEPADELDSEAAVLGSSEKFASFLSKRSNGSGDLSLEEVRRKRGL